MTLKIILVDLYATNFRSSHFRFYILIIIDYSILYIQ